MTLKLQEVINNAKTLEDLIPISKELKARLSFWGCQYVVIERKKGEGAINCEGSASLNALFKRIDEIVEASGRDLERNHFFSPLEHKQCQLLEREIKRIYDEDRELYKISFFVTKIFVFIRSIFHGDYQYEWRDRIWGRDEQIIRRVWGHEWDENKQDYVLHS